MISVRPSLTRLLQVSLPAGVRCKKLEKMWPAVTPTRIPIWEFKAKPFATFGATPSRVEHTPQKIGNLQIPEFQFWVGQKASYSQVSHCRACLKLVYSPSARHEHMEETKHTKWLQEAYKFVSTCIVCAKPKIRMKWGVPLCPTCEESWMFEMSFVPVLRPALAKAWPGVQARGVIGR